MTAFANEEMPVFEANPIQSEKIVQQGIKNAAGVSGRGQVSGFDGDDDEPENRGDPRLEKIFLVGVQESGPALLDGIVGGLTGDHNVVHVTLAQAGAADANESSFLQEFSDGRASAIAHT